MASTIITVATPRPKRRRVTLPFQVALVLAIAMPYIALLASHTHPPKWLALTVVAITVTPFYIALVVILGRFVGFNHLDEDQTQPPANRVR